MRLQLKCILKDISLELIDTMGRKTGVVVVRFTKIESLPPGPPQAAAKPGTPANVPSDPVFPRHALSDKKILQNAGYQSQDVSMDQVT